ncbi:MAG: type II toxin-antitoxin system VapC family toxin [Thermomicrobiales bacterium]
MVTTACQHDHRFFSGGRDSARRAYWPSILAALNHDDTNRISTANLLEIWMVIDRKGTKRTHELFAQFMSMVAMVIEPVTLEQVEIARDAWDCYGKGSGHPAQLNFGDCFAYALAKQSGDPLLFVGNDFIHTDVPSAIPR